MVDKSGIEPIEVAQKILTEAGKKTFYIVHPFSAKILFSVKDTGVGVKEDDRQKLFKTGGVGKDSLKVNVRSSGYGLAFIKGVIEKHNGRVWFESAGAGKGSTFFVELPIT